METSWFFCCVTRPQTLIRRRADMQSHRLDGLSPMEGILRPILLEEEKKGLLLEKEICTALLREDTELESAGFHIGIRNEVTSTYPKYPLYIELCEKLVRWMETGLTPYSALKKYDLLDESIAEDSRRETMQRVTCLLSGFGGSLPSEENKRHKIREVLNCLGKRGILDVLGVRRTAGTVDLFPPPLSVMLKAFNKKHNPKSILTVGARALSKHCHRDSSEKWWGVSSGTEQAKNEHACRVLVKLLSDVAWINSHTLPHGVQVLEIRCSMGYGARWSCDGAMFRGFLEPQMSDGHGVHWLH